MNSNNNLKSGQKALSMQVLILAVVIVIIACIGLFIQKSSTSTIFNKGFKNYQRSTELLKDINSVTSNIYKIKNMVASGQDAQEIKKLSDQQIQTMTKDVDVVKKALESDLTDEQKKFYQAISDNMAAYQQATSQVIRLAPQGTGAAYLSVSDEKREAITQLLTQLLEYESGLGEEAYNSSGTIFYIVVAILIILLIACVALIPSFIKKMIASSVVEPLEETSGVLREYAGGKYSRSLTWEADDAIGDLVQSVNALRSKMSASPAPAQAQKAATPEPAAAPAEEKGKSLSDMVKKAPEPAKDGTKPASSAKKAIDKLQDI